MGVGRAGRAACHGGRPNALPGAAGRPGPGRGRAGCNKFSGPYTLAEAGRLRLGPLVTTRSICPDQPTEISFLQALNQAQRYRITGSMLRLYAADTLGTPLASLKAVAAE
ncbi:META domain-containing protein [Hymenobacter cellulosilyticus]|uniref:META domain-containing protein n=1 Tax=Hymenobacter cellulosilyticus TaxID=2932248 RepID=UPI0035CB5E71